MAKILNQKYEAILEFLEGWVVQSKKTILGGGLDIFWNHTLSLSSAKYFKMVTP